MKPSLAVLHQTVCMFAGGGLAQVHSLTTETFKQVHSISRTGLTPDIQQEHWCKTLTCEAEMPIRSSVRSAAEVPD